MPGRDEGESWRRAVAARPDEVAAALAELVRLHRARSEGVVVLARGKYWRSREFDSWRWGLTEPAIL
jgi:hypothetical protein